MSIRSKVHRTSNGVWIFSGLSLLALFASHAWADPSRDSPDCRNVAIDAERLRCYDALLVSAEAGEAVKPALERRLEKQRDLARRAFAVLPHRPNYILYTYAHRPNEAPFLPDDPLTNFEHAELKFQLSLRVPLWNNLVAGNGDLWFGYTQQSYWQAFNSRMSSPFRETSYEPEIGLSFDTDFSILGLQHRLVSIGFAHQSNGRSDPLSRSWNRYWASLDLQRDNFTLTLKSWYRVPESAATDNNPDIADYVGRAEMRAAYKYGDQVYSILWRNSLRAPQYRGGLEMDWSFPFSRRIKGLVQGFTGYGESLIDYNVYMRRVGVGILVEDWL